MVAGFIALIGTGILLLFILAALAVSWCIGTLKEEVLVMEEENIQIIKLSKGETIGEEEISDSLIEARYVSRTYPSKNYKLTKSGTRKAIEYRQDVKQQNIKFLSVAFAAMAVGISSFSVLTTVFNKVGSLITFVTIAMILTVIALSRAYFLT